MKKTVLLIGIGGIGFRHFQALFNSEEDIELYVVDINHEAIERAKEYEDSLSSDICVTYANDIKEIPSHIDIAIIATSSIPRRMVFEKLTNYCEVDNVIFEKFLFPKEEDYEFVERVLQDKKITAYVDCPARIYDIYNIIKEEFKDSKHITMTIKGSNWGLACNSIHIVDLIKYITGSNSQEIVCSGIFEDKIVESKRAGYIEFFGRIVGSFGDRVSFSIECDHNENPLIIEMYSDKYYYCVNEGERLYTKVVLNETGNVVTDTTTIPYVSQITNLNVDSILKRDNVYLPTYSESKPLHLALLNIFKSHLESVEKQKKDICPIT